MKRNICRLATLLVFSFAFEAQAYKKIEGTEKFQEMTLTQTVELEEFEQVKLKSVGHALRNKKVAFMDFKVYVVELLMPIDSTWNQKAADFVAASPNGIQMSFLRDVPADKMKDAFNESLKANQVDTKSESVQAFIKAVKKVGDLKNKDVFLISRKKSDKGDSVLLLIPGRAKEIITGPAGWSDGIMKIWAGKAADSGLEKMQKELFK